MTSAIWSRGASSGRASDHEARRKWWKSWSLRIAALSLAILEVLQVVANNTELPVFLTPDIQGSVYIAALIGVVLTRPVKQKNMEPAGFD